MHTALTGTVNSLSGKMAKEYVPISYDIAGLAVTAKFAAFH